MFWRRINGRKYRSGYCQNQTKWKWSITPWLHIYGRQRKGAHEWMIEFKILPDVSQFQKALDESIQSLNSDYEAKRYNNMTLNPLIIEKIYFTIG
jgi:hypothetical protein